MVSQKNSMIRDETTQKVIEKIKHHLSDRDTTLIEEFTKRFYAHIPPEDYAQTSLEQLYGNIVSLWFQGETREAFVPSMRLFNPNIDDHGWESKRTIVEIIQDDMPFLVDSVTAAINEAGYTVHLIVHPVIRLERNSSGHITALFNNADKEKGKTEAFLVFEIDQIIENGELKKLEEKIEGVLSDVRSAVQDWRFMRQKVRDVLSEAQDHKDCLPDHEYTEATQFLEWMDNNNFTFLGYRRYDLETAKNKQVLHVNKDGGLGVLRSPDVVLFNGLRNLTVLPADIRYFISQPLLLMITKTNAISKVHRRVKLDAIFIKIFDDQKNVIGEHLFVGLFTSTAYNRSAREIPYIRTKLDEVIKLSQFLPSGHSGKALVHIVETYPRDELFQISAEELYNISLGILNLQERQRIALFVRKDPFERFLSCLLYVPKDRYDTSLRYKTQELLSKSFQGEITNYSVSMGDGVLAQVHFMVSTTPGQIPDYDVDYIERQLKDILRSWTDDLLSDLLTAYGDRQGKQYYAQYKNAFSQAYREFYNTKIASLDVQRVETLSEQKEITINLYQPFESGPSEVHFKIYHYDTPLPLSSILPTLENMGLNVITERPFEVKLSHHEYSIWIHDFKAETKDGRPVELQDVRDSFQKAFTRIWHGRNEDDPLNTLILNAGLQWFEIKIIRAYSKYLKQTIFSYTVSDIANALCHHPDIAKLLIDYFNAKFDIDFKGDRVEAVKEIKDKLTSALEKVASIDEDKIITLLINAIESTLRTNFFQRNGDGSIKEYISLKIDSQKVLNLPLPRPMVEIFVFSPRVEGVHLRGGKVARGGLRWSDRVDLRTEILGLMKAQMVKNTVIVPVGSKGGFVCKRLPSQHQGREAVQNEVIECYKTFIRGLLDLTDNLVDGKTAAPKDVICLDAPDPYLVVAADKGTATFSDIANSISLDYGFWLGDAFASGGSVGYDHKKMGITARGAWESVKRHFREINKDIQNEPFTCIGVGDMSGDVFGNGMLLSRQTKLIGAFNHIHIFCDPNPDVEKSYEERERLFNLPRSAWTDYSDALLSKGGRIFDRRQKLLELTPEIKECFNIAEDKISPNELIRVMLKSKVELLWFGGIGTYIKASHQSNTDVGDKANDALRVDAKEVQASIIGEGANLACTQYGRIEFALKGGRINTDAIDNSAGVDTSDHEVNIKILLDQVVKSGDMTVKQRNILLEKMTDDIAGLVLKDNYLQTLALSLAEFVKEKDFENQVNLIAALEKTGLLNRVVEMLPDEEEIARRRLKNKGLTRPELSVVLAYSKLQFYNDIVTTDFPEDSFLMHDLIDYFPQALQHKYKNNILEHPLRKEIISTVVTNEVINHVGLTFILKAYESTGMTPAEIARAYILVKNIFDLKETLAEIFSQDNKINSATQIEMIYIVTKFIQKNILWVLMNLQHPIQLKGKIQAFKSQATILFQRCSELLSLETKAFWEKRVENFKHEQVPEALSQKIASYSLLTSAFDIMTSSQQSQQDILFVGKLYYEVGHKFGITKLRLMIDQMIVKDQWQLQAFEAIVDDLLYKQKLMTTKILENCKSDCETDFAIEHWIADKMNSFNRLKQTSEMIANAEELQLSHCTVFNQHLRALIVND